jgi:hypothetical protein
MYSIEMEEVSSHTSSHAPFENLKCSSMALEGALRGKKKKSQFLVVSFMSSCNFMTVTKGPFSCFA